jgi:hypothetical protein
MFVACGVVWLGSWVGLSVCSSTLGIGTCVPWLSFLLWV